MKKFLSILLILLLLVSVAAPAAAAGSRVVDDAQLLTLAEAQKLNEMAEKIAQLYSIDAVILTVQSLDGKTPQAFADDYFDHNGYGMGSDDSGVLLLLSMEKRDWYISTHARGYEAITNREVQSIGEKMLNDLSSGNYYDAFVIYLHCLEAEFEDYNAGGAEPDFYHYMTRLLTALVIGAIIAAISLLIMRSKMNTAKQQSGASHYMAEGSYDLYRSRDIFLYSRTTKTARNQGGSSGGTHRSSSGRSHGGGGGKF